MCVLEMHQNLSKNLNLGASYLSKEKLIINFAITTTPYFEANNWQECLMSFEKRAFM